MSLALLGLEGRWEGTLRGRRILKMGLSFLGTFDLLEECRYAQG